MARHGTLFYDSKSSDGHLGDGAFKTCFRGHLTLQPPPSTGPGSEGKNTVAVKRPLKRTPGSALAQSSGTGHKRLAVKSELTEVLKEATALQWAAPLLDAVYEYLDKHARAGPSAPSAPRLRFVEAGVTKITRAGAAGSQVLGGAFLVEELIPKHCKFVRFLGNGSAVVPDPDDLEDDFHHTIAQFCAFAQHVQWVYTSGRIYCADWQGMSRQGWTSIV